MSDRMTEVAIPTTEQEAILLAFEEAVDQFCRRQAEFRTGLAAVPNVVAPGDRQGGQ